MTMVSQFGCLLFMDNMGVEQNDQFPNVICKFKGLLLTQLILNCK